MAIEEAAPAAAAPGAQQQPPAAAKPEDFNCHICLDLLLDPVVGEAKELACFAAARYCLAVLLKLTSTTHMLQVPVAMTFASAA
jgi:hypothetical protein